MTANFDQARVELDQSLFLRMAYATGAHITCLEGCLWITRDGSSKDVQLDPGQTYRVEDATRVIVTGFGPSLAHVSRPAVQALPAARRRLASLLSGRGRGLASSPS